ncbi:MAG: methyltransferase domain-containing protein [Candidatus Paceibacterota bacterium]|jgi:predicted SAM-dependent methyltransferase
MKLHLGCGSNIFKGWVNIDLKKGDVKHDLRKPLPYNNSTIDIIYNEHFIEHLSNNDQKKFLNECYRVLKPNGIIRIACPDLELCIQLYLNKTFIKESWAQKAGCKTNCHCLNTSFYAWEHKHLPDYEDIEIKLKEVGYKSVYRCQYKVSKYKELANLETRPPNQDSLIVEAIK